MSALGFLGLPFLAGSHIAAWTVVFFFDQAVNGQPIILSSPGLAFAKRHGLLTDASGSISGGADEELLRKMSQRDPSLFSQHALYLQTLA